MSTDLGMAGRGFGWRMALAGVVVIAVVAGILLPLTDANTRRTSLRQFESSLAEQAETRGNAFFADVERLAADARFLASTPPIQGIVRASRSGGFDVQENSSVSQWQQRLTAIFKAYVTNNMEITQVRYIGVANQGRELVRVDRRDGRVTKIPDDELQAKGNRDYFIDTARRKPGDVYVSDINLNREHGDVEVPHVPTLRVATPVYDDRDQLFGMIVINKTVRQALSALSYDGQIGVHAYLMNADGDFLAHPDRSKTFGFDLGRRYRWQDEFEPTGALSWASNQVRGGAVGLQTFKGPDGLVHAVRRTFPYDSLDPSRYLTVATVVSDAVVAAQVRAARSWALVALAAVGVVIAFSLALITMVVVKREEAYLNEAYVAAIVASTSDAIVGMRLDGTITSWNRAAEQMFGFGRDAVVGHSEIGLIVPLERQPEAADMLARVRDGEVISPFDSERQRADGSLLDVSVSVAPIRTPGGDIVGVAEVVRDITEKKAAEARILSLNATLEQQVEERTRELTRAKAEAEAANRAKSQFLANMSHEIRTPMNAVLGMLQLLDRTDLTDQQFDYVDKASAAASALLTIISDILDFSKIEAGKLTLEQQPFVLNRLLRDVGIIAAGNVGEKKNLEVLFDVDPQVPQHLVGDGHRIKQVLVNLMGNAVKFTEQGEVVLRVQAQSRVDDTVWLHFAVRDTGIGMSAEQQQRIFDAFVQADAGTTRLYGGTGLGLVICQRLVDLLGGELQLQSEEGKGSVFSFELPLERATADQAAAFDIAETTVLRGLRVLIVDDSRLAREIMVGIASAFEWESDAVDSCAAAIDRLRTGLRGGAPYDAVVVDWHMPDKNGWQLAREIHDLHQGREMPVLVMVSAYPREALAQASEGDRALIDGFLTKPLTASDLFDAVSMSRAGIRAREQSTGSVATGERLVGIRLLVVEDNLANQQVARGLLESEGATVVVAGDGRQGLDALRHASEPFDLVLMDVQMPRMDGYAATRKIRSELGLTDLPVVAMTANVMAGDIQDCFDAGMNDHIGKPFDFEEMVAKILRITGRAPAPPRAFPGAPQDLPEVPPGFDIAAAVRRLNNNWAMFAQQAAAFAQAPPVTIDAIRAHLDGGDTDAAASDLHTLRGVAGTLGAQALSEALAAAEETVKHADEADHAARLATLAEQLEEARRVLAAVAQVMSEEPAATPAAQGDVRPMFEELDRLLAESNMRALDVLGAIRAGLGARAPESMEDLEAAANALDFSGARRRLAAVWDDVRGAHKDQIDA